MSPALNWPNQVSGPNLDIAYHKEMSQKIYVSKLPHPITRTWETRISPPDWLLNYFHIPCGLITVIEIYISVHQVWKQENALFFEVAFMRQEEIHQPHRVEDIIFMVTFSWPNPYYQERASRAACTPSCITLELDSTFNSNNSREGSISPVPSGNPPGYPTLSPQPPQLTPLPMSESAQEEVLPIPMLVFTWVPSNTLSIQAIYQRIRSGTDLNQVIFNEGGITFWNLQTLDHQKNPQLYCILPDTAGEYYLPTFQEDTEEEREVEDLWHYLFFPLLIKRVWLRCYWDALQGILWAQGIIGMGQLEVWPLQRLEGGLAVFPLRMVFLLNTAFELPKTP